MLDNILFYANLGVDLIRIDAPAFIWKETGTSCQNLPQAHTLLQLIKQAVQIASPGMAILGEAIVAPNFIMEYFGKGDRAGNECDFAYNATQMALQWDMLASGDTRVMLEAQPILQQKPPGTSWIAYTRCHDDIGLGYDDWMISKAGKDPYMHRSFFEKITFPVLSREVHPAGLCFLVIPRLEMPVFPEPWPLYAVWKQHCMQKMHIRSSFLSKKILLMQAFSIFSRRATDAVLRG